MLDELRKVQRLDSIRLDSTYFTDEGYFVDHPILTSVGIFEYTNPDGSIRRELRLPEYVFDKKSLKTYKGKPIIITHDAGVVDKDNVEEEQIGTIMSAGYRDSEDVRAEIIIHNTDAMKECGLKELSLGYSLDLVEEPGTWKGEHYDAIQTNIRINHLALVGNARAGEQARLNIDSKDKQLLKGGKVEMAKRKSTGNKKYRSIANKSRGKSRYDSVLSPEEMELAVAAYLAGKEHQADEEENNDTLDPEEILEAVREHKDRRDSEEVPDELEEALEVILQQDEDISSLLDVIEHLQAESDFSALDEDENEDDDENSDEDENADEDEDYSEDEDENEDEEGNQDESGSEDNSLNADSADKIIRERLAVCRIGDRLNMDGLESMPIMRAKKAIIRKVLPNMRMDGKGDTYINAMYDLAVQKVKTEKKGVAYQRVQMTNGMRRQDSAGSRSGAATARAAMIARREGGK